jgi:hypothetical protein
MVADNYIIDTLGKSFQVGSDELCDQHLHYCSRAIMAIGQNGQKITSTTTSHK